MVVDWPPIDVVDFPCTDIAERIESAKRHWQTLGRDDTATDAMKIRTFDLPQAGLKVRIERTSQRPLSV